MKDKARQGYKQTKLGWIPEEWSMTPIKALTTKIGDGLHSTPIYSEDTAFFFINGNNLVDNKIVINENTKCVEEEEYIKHKKTLDNSTLFLSINGTIGNIAFYNNEKVVLGKSAAYLNIDSKNSKEYIAYQLQTYKINNLFKRVSTGSTIKNLGLKEIQKIELPIPPLPEQQKIASILNTWDKAIAAQEQLIAQKQALKKGLMQQLLTGKKRFSGFEEEWEEVRLKNILDYEQPTKYLVQSKNYSKNYGTPVLTANKSFVLGYTNEQFGIYDKLPIILFDDFTTDNKWVDFKFKVKSSAIKILKLRNQDFDLRFIYERMQLLRLDNTDHKRHYISEYQYLKFYCPGLEEQRKISSTIKESEVEIMTLKNHLNFLKKQKRGLMQQLLTGEKRVKI